MQTQETPTYVIIMAGGIGTRFWPVSRTEYPKQFQDIMGTGRSLLQETVRRFSHVCAPEHFFVVTNKQYVSLVGEQVPEIPKENILGEPYRRNTAPCVAYAAQKIAQKSPQANLIVTPADALILDTDTFIEKIEIALKATRKEERIVTIGIKPTRPDTNYGYIQMRQHKSPEGLIKVKTFTEKPNAELAEEFYKSGEFVWNAGIFVWNVQTVLKNFSTFLPDLMEYIEEASVHFYTDKEEEAIEKAYSQSHPVSIDYGIMEHARNVFVVPCDCGWSDLGTWKALYEVSQKDEHKNVRQGRQLLFETSQCMIKTPAERLVVLQGLENYLVAEHDNVLLVCQRDQEHRIKAFLEAAKGEDEAFT